MNLNTFNKENRLTKYHLSSPVSRRDTFILNKFISENTPTSTEYSKVVFSYREGGSILTTADGLTVLTFQRDIPLKIVLKKLNSILSKNWFLGYSANYEEFVSDSELFICRGFVVDRGIFSVIDTEEDSTVTVGFFNSRIIARNMSKLHLSYTFKEHRVIDDAYQQKELFILDVKDFITVKSRYTEDIFKLNAKLFKIMNDTLYLMSTIIGTGRLEACEKYTMLFQTFTSTLLNIFKREDMFDFNKTNLLKFISRNIGNIVELGISDVIIVENIFTVNTGVVSPSKTIVTFKYEDEYIGCTLAEDLSSYLDGEFNTDMFLKIGELFGIIIKAICDAIYKKGELNEILK